jgi:hypothetical protein
MCSVNETMFAIIPISSYYMEVGTGTATTALPNENENDVERWVEVTNKGNQTPSHWVYSDMINGGSSASDMVILSNRRNNSKGVPAGFHEKTR